MKNQVKPVTVVTVKKHSISKGIAIKLIDQLDPPCEKLMLIRGKSNEIAIVGQRWSRIYLRTLFCEYIDVRYKVLYRGRIMGEEEARRQMAKASLNGSRTRGSKEKLEAARGNVKWRRW